MIEYREMMIEYREREKRKEKMYLSIVHDCRV